MEGADGDLEVDYARVGLEGVGRFFEDGVLGVSVGWWIWGALGGTYDWKLGPDLGALVGDDGESDGGIFET